MNNLYEALEICLQDIEKGVDLDSVLFRYPDLSGELRPILEASAGAKSMAVPAPSPEVVQRNRAKVLQHAAQMRESEAKPSRRTWFVSLRRLAVTLAVVAVILISGTGLVSASSNTLPGDGLYPVKRTWEGLSLLLTFDSQQREVLEREHENKRLYETKALLEEGRSEEVDFNGQVTSQYGNEWVVAGIRVLISDQTEIRDGGIIVGSPVRVRGITQGDNTVLAERIRLLSDDAKLPGEEDGHESGGDNEDNSGPGSGDEDLESPENDSSGPGSNTNTNENDNDNSGSSTDGSGGNDNSNDDGGSNSGSGNGDDGDNNDNEDNSGSGGGGNSGPGGGGGSDEDNSGPGGGGY